MTQPPRRPGIQKPGYKKPGYTRQTLESKTPPKKLKNNEIAGKPVKFKKVFGEKEGSKSEFGRKKKVPLVLIALVVMIAIFFVSSFLSYTYVLDRFKNPIDVNEIVMSTSTSVKFKIETGTSTANIADNLKKLDLIKSKNVYRFLSKFNGYDGQYKIGTYTLCKNLTYDETMMILSSKPESIKITIPEGFTTTQIAARLEANGLGKASAFLDTLGKMDVKAYPFLTDLGKRDVRLEGYLFPDTYEFDVSASEEIMAKRMVDRFNQVFTPEYYSKAKSLGMSVDQIMILASIIEREAKLPSERKIMAGVFYNRLNSETDSLKKLQSCATIQYVYKKLNGTALETVTVKEEKIDDPYNTYMYKGLPPGPICNPSKESIEAALNPEKNSYYFFVLKKDGSGGHYFANTYEEHLSNIAKK